MKQILEAILSGDTGAVGELDVPEHYRGITVHADEAGMFEGLETKEKDPRKSLHLDDVPTPELGPGEALVAVMASAINYNTVWTSIFEPVSWCAPVRACRPGNPVTGSSRTACPSSWRAPTGTTTR